MPRGFALSAAGHGIQQLLQGIAGGITHAVAALVGSVVAAILRAFILEQLLHTGQSLGRIGMSICRMVGRYSLIPISRVHTQVT